MTFHPRMTSKVEGVTVLGELKWRAWTGVVADVWSVKCEPGAEGEYISEDPRLFVTLDKAGSGTFSVGLGPASHGTPGDIAVYPMSYIPAGLPVWGRGEGVEYLRHLDLHFDLAILSHRFPEARKCGTLGAPRLMFFDDRIASLARLIAEECLNEQPLHDLYGDGLTTALVVQLFGIAQEQKRQRSQLSPRQLRSVTGYIEDNCLRNIRLEELAGLAGLSQSYFSHAFKASTGVAPHQWQMKARMRRVQALLRQPGSSLPAIASATGFSDQAHLTRMFKKIVGITPAAWLRDLCK
ncbi:AraC family transcriptional regulator [Phyllobacterium sp. UNC302MFCol5.2]|uniref:helix-turn-helix domain-containing protein n=1 Tax=Phyllobacterium sp. UNC302MFCol5.2 TaxID=1449065 RepID=UPI000486C4B2|nr:AraC family transcriptional regulator [Phyllobacterium sp. UNC302MFCol5.2]